MEFHQKLARHLKQLNRAIRRIVARDKAFEDLRTLLREEQVELAIYVVPLIGGKLTDEDRRFLKKVGIRFDA